MRDTGIPFRLLLANRGKRGWGVLAQEFIPKGSYVMEYCGEIITATQVRCVNFMVPAAA